MFSKINKFLILILLLTFSLNATALDDGDGLAPMDNPEWDEQEAAVPINDPLSYLIIAGIVYGAYYFEKKRKSNQLSN